MFRSSVATLGTFVMKAAALSAYNKLVFLLRLRHLAQWVPEPRRSLKIKLCDIKAAALGTTVFRAAMLVC